MESRAIQPRTVWRAWIALPLVLLIVCTSTGIAHAADDSDKPKRGDEFLLFRETKVELPGGDSRTFDRGTRGRVIQVEGTKIVAMLDRAKVSVPLDNIVAGRSGVARLSAAIRERPDDWYCYLLRANLRVELKDFNAALKDVRNVPEDAREYSYALIYRGLIHRSLGQWDESVDDLTRAVEHLESKGASDQWVATVIAYRAGVYYRQGRIEAATTDIDQAIKLGLEGANIHLMRAMALYAKSRTVEAVEGLRKAKEIDPDNETVRWALCAVFERLELFDLAIAEADDLLTWYKDDPKLLAVRARLFFQQARFDDTLADANRALELDPEHVAARLCQAEVYYARHDDAALKEIYPRLLALKLNCPEHYAQRGKFLLACGLGADALNDLDKAASSDVRDAHLYRMLAERYAEREKWTETVTNAEVAIRLDPRLADSYYLRGIAYSQLDRPRDAMRDLDFAVRLNPQFVRAYVARAGMFERSERFDEALADYRTAFQLAPAEEKVVTPYCKALFKLGLEVEVLMVTKEYMRLTGETAKLYALRAGPWQRLGNYEMAIAEFSEAIRLNPSNVEYFSMRAMCYAMIGKLELALEDCERGMELLPGHSQLAYVRGLANLHGNRLGQALADYRSCIANDERNYCGHLGIAFVLAGAEDATLRNGELAVLHATRGCELTDWTDARALAALANAYAESGDFALAIETISRALDLADSEDQIVLAQYLELFESRQPVRWYAKYRFAGISAESDRR